MLLEGGTKQCEVAALLFTTLWAVVCGEAGLRASPCCLEALGPHGTVHVEAGNDQAHMRLDVLWVSVDDGLQQQLGAVVLAPQHQLLSCFNPYLRLLLHRMSTEHAAQVLLVHEQHPCTAGVQLLGLGVAVGRLVLVRARLGMFVRFPETLQLQLEATTWVAQQAVRQANLFQLQIIDK